MIDPKGLRRGPPKVRKHTHERSVLQHPMVNQRSEGVKRGQYNQRVRDQFMSLFHIVGKRTVCGPRRSYLCQTKNRQGIAARELQDDAGNWSCN